MPQVPYFISGFTINSTSIEDYRPVVINKSDLIHFHGVLTSYIGKIMHGGHETTFKDAMDLIVQLNLITPADPKTDNHNPLDTQMVRITMDQRSAAIDSFPKFTDPTAFEVILNPFENETITQDQLPENRYYLEVAIYVRPRNVNINMPIFNISFPARVHLESDGNNHGSES